MASMVGVLRINGQSDPQLRGSRCRRDVKRATARAARRFTVLAMRDVVNDWQAMVDGERPIPRRFTHGYES
jgi:hypothetical protein